MEGPNRIGVRELRNQVAAVLRRAEAGDRVVVTVDGRPVAQLGPIEPEGGPSLDDLVAAGLVVPPRRSGRPDAPDAAILPVDLRPDRIIEEVRR